MPHDGWNSGVPHLQENGFNHKDTIARNGIGNMAVWLRAFISKVLKNLTFSTYNIFIYFNIPLTIHSVSNFLFLYTTH